MFAKFQSDLSKIVEDMLKKEQYLLLKQWKLRNVWFKLSFYILLPKTCKYSLLNDKIKCSNYLIQGSGVKKILRLSSRTPRIPSNVLSMA